MRLVSLSAFTALSLVLGACGGVAVSDLGNDPTGDDDDSTPVPTAEPQDSFSLSATAADTSMDFLKTSVVNFTVTPANGFTGTVTVDLVDGLASGIRSKGAATVTVTDTNPVTGSLTIDTEDHRNVVPGPYSGLRLRGVSGALESDATFAMTVNARLDHAIPAGIGTSTTATNAYGPGTTVDTGYVLHLGLKPDGTTNDTFEMRWTNNDTVNHTIHTGGYGGDNFDHGQTPTDPTANQGQTQVRQIVPVLDGNGERQFTPNNFYCHVHGSGSHEGYIKFIR